MIESFNHFSFTVSNLEKTVDFYTDILGMEVFSFADREQEYSEKVTGIKGSYLKIAYLKGYGIIVELIEYVGSDKRGGRSSSDNIGAGHICFNVSNLNELLASWKKKGITFKSDAVPVVAGANKGGQVVYAEDPDGIIVELIEPPPK
jgi:lactoylglutathione lyase